MQYLKVILAQGGGGKWEIPGNAPACTRTHTTRASLTCRLPFQVPSPLFHG